MTVLRELIEGLWLVASGRPDLLAQIGALLGGVALVVVVARARGWSPPPRHAVVHDGAYLAAPALITLPLSLAILAGLNHAVATYAPGLQVGWLPGQPWWAQLAVYFVLMDAVAYGIHRAFHAVPWLWRFHAIHHSQRELNPLTTTRIHVMELLTKRVLTWAPLAVLAEPTLTLAWVIVLDGFWGLFVHSGLRVRLGPLRYVLVEPGDHRVHHSRRSERFRTNFAERLVLWDLLLGGARFDDARDLPRGTDDPGSPWEPSGGAWAAAQTWLDQLRYPFRKLRG